MDSSFRDDLEKAKALSLESHAIEEYNRTLTRNSQPIEDKRGTKNGHVNRQVALVRPPARSSSIHDIKPRPRPSTSSTPDRADTADSSKSRTLVPPGTLALSGTGEDLIHFGSSPRSALHDEFKSSIDNLFRTSTPTGVPQSHSLNSFNFAMDQGGRLTVPNPEASGFSGIIPRTIYPVRNNLNRIQYISPSPSPMSILPHYKPGHPLSNFNSGYPSYNLHSPTSLQQITTGIPTYGLVKSQSLNTISKYQGSITPNSEMVQVHRVPEQTSISAHTSPVHHPARNRALEYSMVALPRPARSMDQDPSKPRPRTVQILPDKPKIQTNTSSSKKSTKSVTSELSLIDLSEDEASEDKTRTKVTLLQIFDPLVNKGEEEQLVPVEKEQIYYTSNRSEGSLYEWHNPFDYMLAKAEESIVVDAGETVAIAEDVRDATVISPSPRRSNYSNVLIHPSTPGGADKKKVERRKKEKEKFYEKTEMIMGKCVLHRETDASKVDPEIKAFVNMVTELRAKFKHDSGHNSGIVMCQKIQTLYQEGTSVKVVVRPKIGNKNDYANLPSIKFTCDVNSVISHILWKVLMDLEEKGVKINNDEKFIFAVSGASEYICCDDDSKLGDYDYVHKCYKFDKDVELALIPLSKLKRPLLRTELDDKNDSVIRPVEISPSDSIKTLSFDELKILMEYLDNEMVRMSTNADTLTDCTDKGVMTALRPKQVIQSVKAICAQLGKVETLEVTEACEKLISECLQFDQSRSNSNPCSKLRPEIVDEVGEEYATVILTSGARKQQQNHSKHIKEILNRIKEVIQKLVENCSETFRVNFSFVNNNSNNNSVVCLEPKPNFDILETLLIRVSALHRLQPEWTFNEYMVTLEIYHGTCPVTKEPLGSVWKSKTESFYERVVFDSWIDTIGICSLPRESRLVLTLYGRHTEVVDKQTRHTLTEIGWASIQLFNFENFLAQGSFLLPIWPTQDTEKMVGPAPDSGSHPLADSCPLISIELPELSFQVKFPKNVVIQSPQNFDYRFEELVEDTRNLLTELCDQDLMTFRDCKPEDREIFWEKRYYLTKIPGSLPKVLLTANSWDYASLPSLYGLIEFWEKPAAIDILQFFLPCFPDTHVREVAIKWLESLPCDDLTDFLPQLLEALKHETWSSSPIARLLLERALMSPRVAHSLYWLLTQSLPGHSPQNSSFCDDDSLEQDSSSKMKIARYKRRLQMLMRALYIIIGGSLRNSFLKQQELIHRLRNVAMDVKKSKEGYRATILNNHLNQINDHLRDENPTMVPLSLGLVATGIDVKASSYFPSNALPLKLCFISETGESIPVMFKVGDDLRQDQLTLQMIRLMDKIWLREGLDLKMVTFACVPTGHRHGIIELVPQSKTLREIQVIGGRGVTGSFKDTTITEWLMKHNPSQIEFNNAVQNFTRSCVGYSIITYVLGICDRHNDNIMVKQTGHLFHIDFGKFLGDHQMFGSFKRDRTPFVLTPDMLHVINGGNKPTLKFQDFVELCCRGYNLIRKNGNLILNLFALMASSGIPGVTHDALSYVQNALCPDLSSTEAAATFARLIEESLSNWFTQVNFFIHNLNQLRFNDDGSAENGEDSGNNSGELLSFVPKTYSQESDGRIEAVVVYGIQKRYQPERHYLFILKITRKDEKGATLLFRTYKEFCELYSKLNRSFPKSGLMSLEKGLHIGRQEIREVAERRKHDIATFLQRLFNLQEKVSHSDLVYTFFHPLLRDEEETDIRAKKHKNQGQLRRSGNSSRQIQGKLKLSLEYRRNTLLVMVCHAQDLAVPDVSKEEPNSYVKVYLHPDPHKITKRKTRVIHKNCHPSFMEMLEYRISWDLIKERTLQASIWNTDRFQENQFLGAVEIPLEKLDLQNKTVIEWYPLTNFKRISGPRMT